MCSFLNSDGLCGIQLELGEEYLRQHRTKTIFWILHTSCLHLFRHIAQFVLVVQSDEKSDCAIRVQSLCGIALSNTCRRYPRKNILNNGVNYYCIGLSCYEVISRLMNSENSAKLCIEQKRISNQTVINYIEDSKVIAQTPALQYRKDIILFLYDIISDKSYSVETGIALGALAMQKISQFADKGETDRIPEVIQAIKPHLRNPAQIAKLESIKPNYSLKHSLVGKIFSNTIVLTNLHDSNGNPDNELYRRGEENFAKAIADRPFAKRNLMLGALFDLRIPYFSDRFNLYENYCYFAVYAAVVNYVAAGAGLVDNPEYTFKLLLGKLNRIYMHSKDNIDTTLNKMKELGCTSPAYLASLIK